jgi:hypothetical protein
MRLCGRFSVPMGDYIPLVKRGAISPSEKREITFSFLESFNKNLLHS